MIEPLRRYARWLHTGWPAGTVEPLPDVGPDGVTNVPGVHVTGDLIGVPLLKLAADSGAGTVRAILAQPSFAAARTAKPAGVLDLVIVGAGVSGMAAALEARRAGLDFAVFEAKRRFQTVADFPRGKPIYTYPIDFTPRGALQVSATVKEALVEELAEQTAAIEVTEARVERVHRTGNLLEVQLASAPAIRALRVIVAVGRSGSFRKLGVPGEALDHVHNRLHDPRDHAGRRVLVVGGGDAALETAIALAQCGAEVTLAHRGRGFDRAKPDNVAGLEALLADPAAEVAIEQPSSERVTTAAGPFLGASCCPGRIRVAMETVVVRIEPTACVLRDATGRTFEVPSDVVFSMIGREAPLDFFRRCAVRIRGEWTWRRGAALAAFLLLCLALYDWKSGGRLDRLARAAGAWPYSIEHTLAAAPPGSLAAVLRISAASPSFWYTLVYSALVLGFGLRRVRRTPTPYVRLQTGTLAAIQIVPLFLLPEILLPWLDAHGWLPATVADGLFPRVDYGHGREFWRAYGLILAWPLNVYNVFTEAPLWPWLIISAVQTLVLIPLMIFFWGKGAYCGWICSCGALAETLGDGHRHKMPHGQRWNRLNLAGQVVLAVACLLLLLRIASWMFPGVPALRHASYLALSGSPLSYKWIVDVLLAGVVGYGVYFWFSGRVWCRFFCPLAALMHVYARFSRFRILADKKKCISCNVCTSVCHQGIDVMNFANKGLPMADPQCVRCSACVAACPTGVLSFGQVDRAGAELRRDRLPARLPT